MSARQPICARAADWLRERRIRRLCEVCKAHMAAGRSDEGRLAWALMVHEIKHRSPQQVARMERAMGLHE